MDISDPVLIDILGQAPQLYATMLTSKGEPLVTPELYAFAGGRLWVLTARSTLKGRSIQDCDALGVVVHTARGAAVLQCTAERYDITEPTALVTKVRELGDAAVAVTSFLARNGIEMIGAARDAVLGRLGTPPDVRVLLALNPTVAEVDGGGSVDAALGWRTASGSPLALPARWSDDDGVARVHAAIFDAFDAASSGPASVCVDEWTGTGPSGKQGHVVRGDATTERQGDDVVVTIDVERITTWDGVEVSTSRR